MAKRKLNANDMLTSAAGAAALEVMQAATTAPADEPAKKAGRPRTRKDEPYIRICTAIPKSTREKIDRALYAYSEPGHLYTIADLLTKWADEDEARRAKKKK